MFERVFPYTLTNGMLLFKTDRNQNQIHVRKGEGENERKDNVILLCFALTCGIHVQAIIIDLSYI